MYRCCTTGETWRDIKKMESDTGLSRDHLVWLMANDEPDDNGRWYAKEYEDSTRPPCICWDCDNTLNETCSLFRKKRKGEAYDYPKGAVLCECEPNSDGRVVYVIECPDFKGHDYESIKKRAPELWGQEGRDRFEKSTGEM